MKRVVITGVGAVSPFGSDVDSLIKGIEEKECAVKYMDSWNQYLGLKSLVAAPAELLNAKDIPRKKRRSMGRMGMFAAQAAEQAVNDSGLDRELLSSGRVGCVVGSTIGSPEALSETFELILPDKNIGEITSMEFFKFASHTAAMNVSQYLEISGCVLATSAACASSLQALGAGLDLIRLGRQDVVLCGGAEEVHPTVTGIFDVLYATSTKFNDKPKESSRPFDLNRDGVVCGEGAGILMLEEYEHAKKRNAKIYAEVVGYHTCGSGNHISQSDRGAMIRCMNEALKDAKISPSQVDYVNAHATATKQGDVEEVQAIKEVFGENVPVSSLKGYIGHTLGASGSLELIASLEMMKKGVVYPTLNLENIDPECDGVCHVKDFAKKDIKFLLKNCFAFGGINATLICKKC